MSCLELPTDKAAENLLRDHTFRQRSAPFRHDVFSFAHCFHDLSNELFVEKRLLSY